MSRADLDAQRAAFEEAVLDQGFSQDAIGRDDKGVYYQMDVRMMRRGWQAAMAYAKQAALAAQAPVQDEPVASDAEDAALYRNALVKIVRGEIEVFDKELGEKVLVSMGTDEMQDVAEAAIDAARKPST